MRVREVDGNRICFRVKKNITTNEQSFMPEKNTPHGIPVITIFYTVQNIYVYI